MRLIGGVLLLLGVVLVERGLHKRMEFGGDWYSLHRDGGGV